MMVLNRVPTMKNLGKLNRPCSSRSVEIFVHYPILDQPPDFEQIRNLGGHVLNQYEEIHLLYIKIPINNLSRIKDLNGLNVFPDTQYKGCTAQSVEIIKPSASWAAIETQFGFAINGTGINISVIDTGINKTHPDLWGKVLAEYDFVNSDTDATDDHGHGTHLAGIIAGTGNESISYAGVAPDANLLSAKVLDAGMSGWGSDIIDGILWSVANDADVINLSIEPISGGATNGTDALSLAIDWAVRQGVTVIVAAGNNPGHYQVGPPGVANGAITVGATDDIDTIWSNSSSGPSLDFRLKPDICAPGINIISCRASITLPFGNGGDDYYCEASGTSQAAAHVSGVAALLLQAHPSWGPADVKAALLGTTEELGGEIYERGTGRVDAVASTNNSILTDPLLDLKLFGGNATFSTNLTLRNIMNRPISCNLTADPSITLTPITLIIPALSTGTINLTYTPNLWDAFYQEKVIRITYEGIERRIHLCHLYPRIPFTSNATSIIYNSSFSLSGNITLDQYIQSDLVNISLEIWAGPTHLATQPITSTTGTFTFPTLSNASLYRETHPLQVRLVQDGEVKFINQTLFAVQGWASSISAPQYQGRQGSSLRLEWTLTDSYIGEFNSTVEVYLQSGSNWISIGNSTTGSLDYTLALSPGTYNYRLDFNGDEIHEPTLPFYSTIRVEPVETLWDKYGVWIIVGISLFAIVFAVRTMVIRIHKSEPPILPRRKTDARIKEVKGQPPPTFKTQPKDPIEPKPLPTITSKPPLRKTPRTAPVDFTPLYRRSYLGEPPILEPILPSYDELFRRLRDTKPLPKREKRFIGNAIQLEQEYRYEDALKLVEAETALFGEASSPELQKFCKIHRGVNLIMLDRELEAIAALEDELYGLFEEKDKIPFYRLLSLAYTRLGDSELASTYRQLYKRGL